MPSDFRKKEKISVITVCRNAEQTIGDTLRSVQAQTYPDIEHVVVDGASTDGTVGILKSHCADIRWISESDKGIYDAMNKGIAMATGDVIGFLNADDVYAHEGVVGRINSIFSDHAIDACFADLQFINDDKKVVRHYSSARFSPEQLRNGWMPAHPTLYVRKSFFDKVGRFRTDYKIAADYEWVVRAFSTYGASWKYISEVWVNMRMGGVSTQGIKSRWILNHEIVRACRDNGIRTSIGRVLLKFPLKLLEMRK
jgi:glycosyltransferase involved in cell wall biosynthesis